MIFIESDTATNKACKYHCCPSCHPMQTGPVTVYGCKHKAWPCNRNGDFVPIVECGGNPAECEINANSLVRIALELKTRRKNLLKKVKDLNLEIDEIERFVSLIDEKTIGIKS